MNIGITPRLIKVACISERVSATEGELLRDERGRIKTWPSYQQAWDAVENWDTQSVVEVYLEPDRVQAFKEGV